MAVFGTDRTRRYVSRIARLPTPLAFIAGSASGTSRAMNCGMDAPGFDISNLLCHKKIDTRSMLPPLPSSDPSVQ